MYGLKPLANINSRTTDTISLVVKFASGLWSRLVQLYERILPHREVGYCKAFTIWIDVVTPDFNGISFIMRTSRYKWGIYPGIGTPDGWEKDILRQYLPSTFPNSSPVSALSKFFYLYQGIHSTGKTERVNWWISLPERSTSDQESPSLLVQHFNQPTTVEHLSPQWERTLCLEARRWILSPT